VKSEVEPERGCEVRRARLTSPSLCSGLVVALPTPYQICRFVENTITFEKNDICSRSVFKISQDLDMTDILL
jgi:hypothetical protein